MFNIPTYLISLDDATLRRDRLVQHGLNRKLVDDFISATDCRSLSGSELKKHYQSYVFFKTYGHNASPGEIGCSLSHRKIYESIVENDIPLALILEDDVIPVKTSKKKINELIKELSPLTTDGQSFICHLGIVQYPSGSMVFFKEPFKSIKRMKKIWRLNPTNSKLWLAHAYLISNSAAKKILTSEPEVSLVADDWSRRIEKGVLQHVFYTAPLFRQDLDAESQIGNSRFINGLNPMKKDSFKEKVKKVISYNMVFFLYFIARPKFKVINIGTTPKTTIILKS